MGEALKRVKTIGLFANCNKPSANQVLRCLYARAQELNLNLAACAPASEHVPEALYLEPEELAGKIDLLMALGGDGTMLRAVRLLDGRDIPVLGVNLGSLGFLTSVAEDHAEYALTCVARGDFTVHPRALADCRVLRDGREISRYRALNDIVMDRGASSRIATLDLLVEGEAVSSYICDGLIVSTPTGSTGHSLSAGGPILHPETAAWVISLICPHTLSSRPLVIPDRYLITVNVTRCAGDLLLSADGQAGEGLQTGDQVQISASPNKAHFVKLPDYSYFAVLRQKLHWRGSNFT
jgi:NAD+ kinase